MLKKRKRELEYEYEDDFDDEDYDGLDFMELFMMIRRHWRAIVVITVLFTGLGTGFALTRKAVYKAKVTLIVSSGNYYSAKNLDRNEISLNQQLATTYTAVAKSNSVLNAVIRRLDLDTTVEDLSKEIEVASVDDTELITITAKDGDALTASRIANETGSEFMSKVKEIMTFENVKVVEPAGVPDIPESRKRALIIAVSLILGVMTGTFLVILMEMFHSKLRRPKDIEKILGSSILTHVPLYEQVEELEKLHEKTGLMSIKNLNKMIKK
ncbi:MAG: YveK family protein [Fusobacteriaceae bacterium]